MTGSDPVTEHFQNPPTQFDQGRFIIHEQNMLTAGRHWRIVPLFKKSGAFNGRDIHIKGSTGAGFAEGLNSASVALDNTMNHGQPQAGAFPFYLGRKIGMKYFVNDFLRYALAGILYTELKLGARFQTRIEVDILESQRDLRQADDQLSAVVLHGLGGVGA